MDATDADQKSLKIWLMLALNHTFWLTRATVVLIDGVWGFELPYKYLYTMDWTKLINPFHSRLALHIKTSQLIYIANQITGFFMKCKTGLNWVKTKFENPNLQNLATQKNKALTIGIQIVFLHNGAKTVLYISVLLQNYCTKNIEK